MRPWTGRRRSRDPAAEAYARASLPGRRTPWREARYCVVDLELSGLDPKTDEIIAFGAVPIDGGLVGAGRSLYGLARPTRPLPEASVVVHGIRTVDLDEAPPLELAIRPLLEALAGRVLVAHSAQVERAFLGAALRHQRLRLREPVLDTAILGRLLMAERGDRSQGRVSLGQLAAALGLPEHRPHHALGDALTTAQVFLAIASHLETRRPETVGSLARAASRLDNARRYPTEPAVS
ncbi:MAG: PolC-type DNA polymerase III [Acidimicrobiales bacterium]